MKNSNKIKALAGLTGAAAMIISANSNTTVAAETGMINEIDDLEINTSTYQQNTVSLSKAEATTYNIVPNVQGEFTFDQNVITPSSSIFNVFGTAAVGACHQPSINSSVVDEMNYFINFNGNLVKTETVSLSELKEEAGTEERTLKCSCAMGEAVAQAQVTGIPLKNIVEVLEVEEGVNAVTFKSNDGYGIPMPLEFALKNDALLVYKVGNTSEDLPAETQLWMPRGAARYFTRSVTDVEFTVMDEAPEVLPVDDANRAKVSLMNNFAEETFSVGDRIVFEGYADDFDVEIESVEFSMDNGETWTTYETKDATADKWVYWYFGYDAEAAGTYKLDVRCRTVEGRVSPLATSVVFEVE